MHLNIYLHSIITKLKEKNQILLIGIDGPTAAGKTTLADNISKRLKKKFNVFTFRLDWTLKDRKFREDSLKNFKKFNKDFYFEAEDHMNLDKTQEFLKKIELFNKSNKKEIVLVLNNLYDRSGSAKTDLQVKTKIDRNTIIFVEGHYSGYQNIYEYLDYNILLLSRSEELLKRKISRVKNYRSSGETSKYFNLIDVPSFVNYISRFGNNYNLIIDNSNYKKPLIKNNKYLRNWINNIYLFKKDIQKFQDLKKNFNYFNIIKENLSSKKTIEKVLDYVIKIDNFINKNFTLSIDSINQALFDYVNNETNYINKNLKKTKLTFEYTNSFHNFYYKKLPIYIGLKLKSKKNLINLIVSHDKDKLIISFFWKGGSERIKINRILGAKLAHNAFLSEHSKSNISDARFTEKKELLCYIPSDFTYINFAEKYFKVQKILTNLEDFTISAAEISEKINSENIFWIHRFAKFTERNFFQLTAKFMGAETFTINNYLFVFKSNNFFANKEFRDFFQLWKIKSSIDLRKKEESDNQYDLIIDKDRKILSDFINKKTKTYRCLDGQIYQSTKILQFNKKQFYKDTFLLLKSKKRIVRKAIINFLITNNYIKDLECSKLWPNENLTGKISLKKFINISPTILSDLYFWMNLKNNNNAILAANIYDIRKNSLDIHSYLQKAQKTSKPIVLQSSFNAIGHKEKKSEGYLKLKNGPDDFVNNVFNKARDLYLKNNKDFLFGIGLDHVDFRYNTPKGRVNRFLKKFSNVNNITHYTLDSSYLLESKKIKNFDLEKKKIVLNVIKNEISLLKQIYDNHIFDFEFCANELNYIDNEKKVFLPNKQDIQFFAQSFFDLINKSKIQFFNSRPKLIIGNLGTVHHGKDPKYVKSEVSKEWIDSIKHLNFISAVLHGTSRSNPSILKRATAGCFKINVAGDFLQVLVSSLPHKLQKIVLDKNDNEKRKLYLIRDKMDSMTHKEQNKIKKALGNKCNKLMKLIQTPSLSSNDISYFKYKNYNLNLYQAKYIAEMAMPKENKELPYKKKVSGKSMFLLSPIELQYGVFFKKVVSIFLKRKLNMFHLDVGDGKFINRKLDVSQKIKYIKKISNKNIVYMHLMVKNLNRTEIFNKYIRNYCKLGADYIGLHRQSFKNIKSLEQAMSKIINLQKKPGLVIEINEDLDEDIFEIILKYRIEWLVFMGVPIGYGGQIFNKSVIPNILKAQEFISKHNLKITIEVDGGLTQEVLKLLRNYNINNYSGWSIINAKAPAEIGKKLDLVLKII
jgi:ribulose-phosphate 3-epimerase